MEFVQLSNQIRHLQPSTGKLKRRIRAGAQ